jgi:hypothetical protein
MRRRSFLALLAAEAGCRGNRRPPLARAARLLWEQQAADGGWHSRTYGLLRSGQALTPFVLDALLQIPREIYAPPAEGVDRGVDRGADRGVDRGVDRGADRGIDRGIDRAIDFIRRHTQADGALGLAEAGIPDYPNYATGLAVSALVRARRGDWRKIAGPMLAYLSRQQFTEQNGWTREHPAYGAWGMGGLPRTPPDTGHVDLSMTRYVLEALRAADASGSAAAFASAQVYVERCQNWDPSQADAADGGFFFSTTEADTNKAGQEGGGAGARFRSYGTTTADGILALVAIGCPRSHPRVAAAGRWLSARHRDMRAPGFVGDAYQRWPGGLAFYYAAASAQAFRALGADAGDGVKQALLRMQRADGSWANRENLVKEDDPLIATGFAVRALAAGQSEASSPERAGPLPFAKD